jgi:mannitol-1-phosphate 5-dehydrogenase
VALSGKRTFVGFGFGAIQGGLFLYEAFRSGGFRRLVIAEVVPSAVKAVQQAGGWYSINIAHSDRIEIARVGPVEIADPSSEHDRRILVEAVAEAEEIATAVPSVQNYASAGPGGLDRLLADGLRKKAERGLPPSVVYAAENHNHAAEILEERVMEAIPPDERELVRPRVRFLNTVIGKMSGVVTDPREIQERGLSTITSSESRAFLVESFNRILISRICFLGVEARYQRGITLFEEKQDLLPYEEAKLYGHNATHAMAAYIGAVRGVQRIADLVDIPGVMSFLEAAFIQESGETLIRRHRNLDPLFTPAGYREYALDLLRRMTNPNLLDTVDRVGRHPERKLGWDDRILGTMRLAFREGVIPRRYAFGAASALATLDPSVLDAGSLLSAILDQIWNEASPDASEREAMLRLIEDARVQLKLWRSAGYPSLEEFITHCIPVAR